MRIISDLSESNILNKIISKTEKSNAKYSWNNVTLYFVVLSFDQTT